MDSATRNLRLGVMIAVAAAIIFGAHTPAERGVYAEGGNVALILLVTTWARALSLTFYSLATGRKLFETRADTISAFRGGIFQTISILCLFSSLIYLPAPVAIIILFSHTLMLLFYMAWRGEMKLDALTVLTTLCALLGLSLVVDVWHKQADISWVGIGFAFISAVATASRVYVFGHQMKDRNPAAVGAENFLFAAILSTLALCFLPALHLPATPLGYVWLGVASISLAAGTFCMFYGIALLGSFRWSLFVKAEPLFTCLYSVWFLGEFLKPQQYMGIALVISSLVFYQILEQNKMKQT